MSNKAMGPTNLTYLWSKIKDYVSNNSGQIPEVSHGTSDTTFTLTPNVMHIWGTVSSLTLSLPTDSNQLLDEFMFTFTSGSTPTTLSLPSTVKWVQDIEVEANKTYQVSIVNNLAGWLTNGMPSGGGSGGGGENNVIESISVNSVAQTVDANKNVNLQFKTINNESISGTGNISISGGSSVSIITMKARWSGSTLTNFTFDEPATAFDTITGIQSPSDLLNILFVVETGTTNNNQFVSDEYYMVMRITDNTDSSIYCSTYNFFEKYTLEIYIDEEHEVLSVTDVFVDSGSGSSHILSSETNEYDPGKDIYYIDGTYVSDSDAHDLLLKNAWVIHDGTYYYLISSSTSSSTIDYYLATFDKTNSRITVKTIPWRTSQQDFYYTNYNYYSLSGGGGGEANVIESISVNSVAQTVTNKNVDITVPTKVSDLTNDSGFTSNTGTITGITMNNASKGTSGVVDLGTVVTSETSLSKGSTSGSGNAVTDLSVSGHTITLTKGKTFLESESDPIFAASAAYGISSSDITNWNGKTSNVGTITGINMNGASKGTSGVVDLGTVITAHQDISGKADKSTTTTAGTYKSVTVNSSGIVTGGSNPTTLAGYGITDAYTKTESDGQFFGLTNGTELGASSSSSIDLDDITTQGTYYNETSSNAQYISNRPNTSSEQFRLWVYDCGGSNIVQRYRANSSNITYERMSLTDWWGGSLTWNSWEVSELRGFPRIYSGSSAPSSSTGSNGDVYIQYS